MPSIKINYLKSCIFKVMALTVFTQILLFPCPAPRCPSPSPGFLSVVEQQPLDRSFQSSYPHPPAWLALRLLHQPQPQPGGQHPPPPGTPAAPHPSLSIAPTTGPPPAPAFPHFETPLCLFQPFMVRGLPQYNPPAPSAPVPPAAPLRDPRRPQSPSWQRHRRRQPGGEGDARREAGPGGKRWPAGDRHSHPSLPARLSRQATFALRDRKSVV